MTRVIHNKLVRDLIPQVIESSGKTCSFYVLDEAEYKKQLKIKLVEEAKEVMESQSESEFISELGDVLELIDAIKKAYGLSDDDITMKRKQKAKTNGAFEKRLFLEFVEE